MHIQPGAQVTLDFVIKDEHGNVISSSDTVGEFTFVQGQDQYLPAIEKALEGKEAGDTLSMTLEPKDAFGDRYNELVQTVPRTSFKDQSLIEVGKQLEIELKDKGTFIFTVTYVTDNEVTLDANHPLAGKTVTYDVVVKSVKMA